MKKLYRFHWEIRRMGDVDGVFVATEKEIKETIGKTIYFGEVLGKHSEIYGELEEKDLEVLSEDQEFIEKLIEVFKSHTINGYNPLCYIQDEE